MMRLGLRLFLAFFLIVGLAAFFVMRVFINEVKPGVRQAMEANLVDTANILAVIAADDMKAGRIAHGDFARHIAEADQRDLNVWVWRFPKRDLDYRVTVTDVRGIVVYDSQGRDIGRDNSRWNDVYLTLRGEYGARSSPDPDDPEQTVMHVAAPIRDGTQLIGVLTVSKPNRTIDPFIAASQRKIVERGGWLIGLSALIGILMTGWLARGIGRLHRYAQAVAEGQPASPPPRRRDEIGDLGRTLEEMRRRLDGKAYVEHYVQSLTHEMKSPLAAIRGAAELLQEPLPEADRRRFADTILVQEHRLTETIDKLLALAEVEQHGWLQKRERLEVTDLMAAAKASMDTRAEAVQIRLDCTNAVSADHDLEGDFFLLRQALSNLLDNAIAFSPPNSVVSFFSERQADRLWLRIRDHGPGIPDYALDRIFDRFYSLARPGSGQRSSGLGLPFVREVMRLHGGEVTLRNHPDGGVEAVIWLPVT